MAKTRSRGNGEGTIFKRKLRGKDVWVCEYTISMNEDGKRKYKTIYGKTRQEVKDKLELLITDLRSDKYVDKSSVILRDFIFEIVEDGFKLNKLSASSYTRKIQTCNQICRHYIADMEIQKITEKDIKNFLIFITEYSNSVIGKIYGLMNNAFKRAVRKNIIKYNFFDDKFEFCKPSSIKNDKVVRGFTIEEQKKFIECITKDTAYKYHYQFLLSLFTRYENGRNKRPKNR